MRYGAVLEEIASCGYLWNTVTLAWEAATQGLGGSALVSVDNFPAVISGATVPINDGGGSITVDVTSLPLPSGASLDATVQKLVDALQSYWIANKDDDGSPNYYGFLDKSGKWFILRETVSAGNDVYMYAFGSSNYSNGWTNRVGLTYQLFNNAQ